MGRLESAKKRIQFYKGTKWISLTSLDSFLDNFKNKDIEAAYKILEMLNYYGETELKVMMRYLLKKLKRDLYIKKKIDHNISDKDFIIYWKDFLETTCFVTVSTDNPLDSTYYIFSIFKNIINEFDISKDSVYDLNDLNKIPEKTKNIIFLDDFIGWGWQFKNKFLNKHINNTQIGEFISNNLDIDFYYLTIAGYVEGINYLKELGTRIIFITGDLYEESDKISCYEGNNFWIDKFEFNRVTKIINKYVKDNDLSFEYSAELPILFNNSSPKPSHVLLWNGNEHYNPLRRREK